jgi:hypothetical protein
MPAVGSRRQVWNGNADHTSGGLKRKDLIKKNGSIKSKRASQSAKKNNNLINAGWTTQKGEFGSVRISAENTKPKPKSSKRSSKRSNKKSNKRRSKK